MSGIGDPKITELIAEVGIAYVDKDGSICTSEVNSPFVKELADMLRNSTVVLGGKFYGEYPKIRAVAQSAVREHLQKEYASSSLSVLHKGVESSEAAKKLRRLLEDVIERGASDIHIRNVIGERTEINIRVNGDFIDLRDQSPEYGEELLTYIVMNLAGGSDYSLRGYADCNFNASVQETLEVDGKSQSFEKETSWRMSQIPVLNGSKVTIRSLNSGGVNIPTLAQLGLSKGMADEIEALVNSGEGIFLVTGPTGSGKTTVVNSALSLAPTNKVINTLEDPIEWVMPHRNAFQTKVDESFKDKNGYKAQGFFANSLRLLRADSDIVFFGELRESSAADQALRMAETGQFVLATLHTNSAVSSISTLIEQMGISAAKLSSPGVLRAMAHQRLVKTLCPKCSLKHEEAQELAEDNPLLEQSIDFNHKLNVDLSKVRYLNPNGCQHCSHTGQPGRTAIFELVIIDRQCREYIKNMDLNGMVDYLQEQGWPSIREHGISKLEKGLIDVSTLAQVVDALIPIEPSNIYKKFLE
ncbi:GspE/PulE family protein [Vibrio sp. PNB22_3_1]